MTVENPARLAFLVLGVTCVLTGLMEISRLVVLYCLSTGWKAKFCLELAAYAAGAVWVYHQFWEEVRSQV